MARTSSAISDWTDRGRRGEKERALDSVCTWSQILGLVTEITHSHLAIYKRISVTARDCCPSQSISYRLDTGSGDSCVVFSCFFILQDYPAVSLSRSLRFRVFCAIARERDRSPTNNANRLTSVFVWLNQTKWAINLADLSHMAWFESIPDAVLRHDALKELNGNVIVSPIMMIGTCQMVDTVVATNYRQL